jgi:phage baseplate assembly protein V
MTPETTELERRLSNLIRIGTVSDADYKRAKVRVDCDGLTTDWLPWITHRAHRDIDWWAPEIGEQVVIMAPSGLLEDAFVFSGLYSDNHPEPESDPDKHVIRYANGDSITHDRRNGSFFIQCAGDVKIQSGGNLEILVSGRVTVTADNVVQIMGTKILLNE